jgi:hypothetical protein
VLASNSKSRCSRGTMGLGLKVGWLLMVGVSSVCRICTQALDTSWYQFTDGDLA